jgi:hypothetical protein
VDEHLARLRDHHLGDGLEGLRRLLVAACAQHGVRGDVPALLVVRLTATPRLLRLHLVVRDLQGEFGLAVL